MTLIRLEFENKEDLTHVHMNILSKGEYINDPDGVLENTIIIHLHDYNEQKYKLCKFKHTIYNNIRQ